MGRSGQQAAKRRGAKAPDLRVRRGERLTLAEALRFSGVAEPDRAYDSLAAHGDKIEAAERAYTKQVFDQLSKELQAATGDEKKYASVLRLMGQTPGVSIRQALSARNQLRWKAARREIAPPSDTGLLFAPGTWKKFGRQVKPEFLRAPGRDFDDRYAAVCYRPLKGYGKKTETDNDTGEEKLVSYQYDLPGQFEAYLVYHEEATEPIPGSEGTLPHPEWLNASGSDEDANKLLDQVRKLAAWQELELVFDPHGRSQGIGGVVDTARLDRERKQVIVDSQASPQDQAAAALRAVCENLPFKSDAKDDRELRFRRAVAESVKYAIASLYGIDSGKQGFPFLAEFSKSDKQVKRLYKFVEQHTRSVLERVDPRLQLKAQQLGGKKDAVPAEKAAKAAAPATAQPVQRTAPPTVDLRARLRAGAVPSRA